MRSENKKRNIILPIVLTVCLLISLLTGGSFFKRYLEAKTFEERTTQLVEITSQVRVNLDNALDFHWNYLAAAVNMLDQQEFGSEESVFAYIGELERILETDKYSARLMLLDSGGNCCDADGKHGVWSDIDMISSGDDRYTFISDSYIYQNSFWTFVQKLDNPISAGDDGAAFTHIMLLKDIKTLTEYYDSDAYGSQNEMYILKSNGTRMHDDIYQGKTIQAYNVLKVLEEMEGQSYHDIKAALAENGTISSNFINDGVEYYYCITSLAEYDTLLLFLIPARFVASGTVTMVNTVVRTLLLLASLVIALVALASAAIMRQRSSARLFRQEQINLRRQEESNAMLAKAKESAEQAFQIAEEANRAKSSFLSNMSHDIRTPMNAVIGFASLLERDADDPEKVREYTKKITSSSQHLLGLINDVLDISKIEAGKTTLNMSDENMAELIENIDSIIRPQMKAKNHTFEVRSKDIENESLVMDKLRLNQILLNLLSNAVKYTPDGGRVIFTVQEIPHKKGHLAHFRFIVEDNGYGMSPEYMKNLFRAFTREEDSVTNKIQGTGLGMAITKNLLDLMGGTIAVESEKGKGSKFTVDLNLQISEYKTDRKKADAVPDRGHKIEDKTAEHNVFNGMNILAAEDNDINAEILTELLSMVGAKCKICENGKLAAEEFERSAAGQYQLILMDVQMPVMNGYEATRTIRELAHPCAKTIPIVAMTANAFAEDVRDALEAGMNAHVAKPIDMSVLESVVRSVIESQSEQSPN